jgi:hypothetical protein
MKVKFDKLLKNKILLYVIFLIALFTIFNFIYKQNYHAALFFILVAFLARYFSNNMIIILGISIIATYLLDLFRVFSIGYLEGMNGGKTKITKATRPEDDSSSGDESSSGEGKDEGKGEDEDLGDESHQSKEIRNTPNTNHAINDKNNMKQKTGFTNMKLNPAILDYKQGSGNLKPKQADDKELAYDNLEKLLSSDQVRGMSSDAKALTDKQNQIMSQLKDMTPLVNQALKFLKDFDMSTINNIGDKLEGAIDTLKNIKSQ